MTSKRNITAVCLILIVSATGYSQINLNKVMKSVKKNAEKQIEQRIERKADKTVDKTLDQIENGADNAVKGLGKKKDGTPETQTNDAAKPEETTAAVAEQLAKPAPVLEWKKYDFIPGTELIFEDNQEGEQNGEFPSKWDLVSGSIENAQFDQQNVIYFIKANANGGGNIVPMLKNSASDYLPEEFTIEFDAYFGEKSSSYLLYLADTKNQTKLDNTIRADQKWIRFGKNGGEYEKDIERKFYPGFSGVKNDVQPKWRHMAISFNTRALKAYMDDARILNIPNLGYNPTGLSLAYHNPSGTTVGYVKNIRIAKGAVPLYDKFLTDGKFVTTGIKFDVAKATIKPENMGTINYVAKMMMDHPELKFSVEGHTDSDGDVAANQKLSEARANAVVEALKQAGIAANRLSSKGFGESKPMTGNDTTEGKAQNRRVEFVKL